MARQGVFNREVTQLEQIKRSLQQLNHRHSTTLEYGVIIPNFSEYLYPNETLRLRTTNYLRTIPLKTPQLTRVRVVQRFVAFPLRILWEYFPEYINALNPPKEGLPEEPYIVNFNRIASWSTSWTGSVMSRLNKGTDYDQSTLLSEGLNDVSTMSIGDFRHKQSISTDGFDFPARSLKFSADEAAPRLDGGLTGYQFFPHELGDYLNAPLYSACLSRDTSSRFSAYKFAAYQLAYSFFYRRPNIEERIDDFIEMEASGYKDQLFSEYPSFYSIFEADGSGFKLTPPASKALALIAGGSSRSMAAGKSSPSGIDFNSVRVHNFASESGASYIRASSWENVEHFPLKAGGNLVMQARYADSNGRTQYIDSTISLTRLRYAPWFLDRFTSSNPWPQRGDEALIPVNGTIQVTLPNSTTVSFSNLSVAVPSARVTNEFGLNNDSIPAQSLQFAVGSLVGDSQSQRSTLFYDEDFNTVTGSLSGNHILGTMPVTGTTSGSASASFSSSSANVQYALNVSPSNFRFYMQLQHMKEMSGMTDGRYKSFLSMFFGSHDKDYRLDRPEFIGGFVQDLDISEVIQTSETTSDSPLGAMAGRGISAKRGVSISYHAFEHCLVMGFLHVVPDVEYIGGLNRQDNTIDPFDWVLPQFAGLSEQPIRIKELCCLPSSLVADVTAKNNEVFGYEPRFNERRARHSYVTGAFRDVMNSTGDYEYYKPWLVTRNFGFDPEIGTTAVSSDVRFTSLRFAVPSLSKAFVSTQHNCDYSNFDVTDPSIMKPFLLDSYFEERLTAIIPRRGIPKI